jgi:hypothetical protein
MRPQIAQMNTVFFHALFLSRQAPMIFKKIFNGFLPAGHKKIRSIRVICVQEQV